MLSITVMTFNPLQTYVAAADREVSIISLDGLAHHVSTLARVGATRGTYLPITPVQTLQTHLISFYTSTAVGLTPNCNEIMMYARTMADIGLCIII